MLFCSSFHTAGLLLVHTAAFVSLPSYANANSNAVNDSLACALSNPDDCQIVKRDAQDDGVHPPHLLRGLSTHFSAEFNTLPPGGWSNWTVESGGLEWLWASPVAVTEHYYETFPSHINQHLTCNDNRFSTNNFPKSVQLSGFRLPTAAELQDFKPLLPPLCMARYINNGAHWCDEHDYTADSLITSDESCFNGCCDTVYVRPVGTPDVDVGSSAAGSGDAAFPCYGIRDSDGDGVCNDVDNCVRTPNPLQGYAFLDMNASCSELTIELNLDGAGTLDPNELDNGASDKCAIVAITSGQTEFDCSDIGETIMDFYSVTDDNGNNGSCITNITVRDSVAPFASCKDVSVSLDSNGVVTIDDPMLVDDGSYDACGLDWIHVSPSEFDCHDIHEPQPIVVSVMDTNGNVAFCDAHVQVINEAPTWWEGLDSMTVMVGSDIVTLFVDVSDPEGQPMTYEWNHTCIDANVDVVFRANLYSNEASIQFPRGSEPKLCEVRVEVCDICGTCLVDTSDIVLVDPKAGSIMGAGWFESPIGAYINCTNSTGMVSFGFIAEYKQGQSVPTGDVQFFTPDFDFHSTSYEWLVVGDDDCGMLKGHGAMYPDRSEVEFSLVVCDGSGRETHDEIVVRIWSVVDGSVVFNNGSDTLDVSFEEATKVKGGNIQVQKVKGDKL